MNPSTCSAARTDDGAGDGGVAQRPGDGDLRDRPVVPRGDAAQDVHDSSAIVSCGSLNHAAFRRQSSSGSEAIRSRVIVPDSSPDCIGE